MAQGLPIDQWLPVSSWRPNSIVPSVCRPFLFHHFRPVGHDVVRLAEQSGSHCNETRIIAPEQVSLILNLTPGHFACITITSQVIDRKQRLPASEYQVYHALGQAKFWYCDYGNFFQGAFEVFNGPNPIDITGAG